jgi:eukaryotic-like serine/threonine-protein kinase
MPTHKRIAPRFDTPAPEAATRTSDQLPQTLVSEHVSRLAVSAVIGAGLWTYGLVMDTIVRPLTVAAAIPAPSVVVAILSIAVSLLMFFYVRFASHAAERKADAGLVYVVLNAAAVAFINATTGFAAQNGGAAVGVSWNTVVILVAAMVVPATPRKMLIAALISACMDPIGAWIAFLYGAPVASLGNTLVLYMPDVACAIVAALPAHVLHRIGRRLRQAQEMGSYQLVELLGRGGMGEVWRAQHRFLARNAAIKLIRPELLGAGSDREANEMVRRFEREAQATASLSSPHTIQVFDFGATADHTFYYVMELLEGRDLQALVREFGPVPAGRALSLLRQVCHSLAEAHNRGLVHGDVTPSNIYVCRMGLDYDFVKVLDFGLVKSNGRRSRDAPPSVHTTTGTPAFMAPEIVLGADVDQRADVYAIGCVAYYLLTGQTVFEGDTASELFAQHLQARPIPPSRRTEMSISREIDALVLACLAKDPRRRPQDASAVLEMLSRCPSHDLWDNDLARNWWERHLVELTGPRIVSDDLAFEPAFA